MLSQNKLDRMSELAQKKKAGQLTPEELVEQKELRAEYLQSFRAKLTDHITTMGMEPKPKHSHGCGCGCGPKH